MDKFGDAERKVKALFPIDSDFTYRGIHYTVKTCGKPTCRAGEPKTDIYVLAIDDNGTEVEFKISYKKENADFIENKTNSERAEAIFGSDWKNIIISATKSISEAFDGKHLVFKKKEGRTEEGAITLGWKYELLNKSGGELSGVVELTHDQIIDVYAGTNLPADKKNAQINGTVVPDSGIATHILMEDSLANAQQVMDDVYTVEEYVAEHPTVYFACKALNYRTKAKKWDGNRPLSVYVDWFVKDGKLSYDIVYDKPLVTKGNEVAEKLILALTELGIDTTDDINESNFEDSKVIAE